MYGPFEVLERLGVGGMATVHRAIERGQDGRERVVALKRLLPHLAEDAGFVRSFVREARLASLLLHPNIVEIYELGRVGASYFISMEYIPGRDLRAVMRHARRTCGPPPVGVALAIFGALLDALAYAHSRRGADGMPLGLVHRDISPSNLIISHTGEVKVIDFGIAKATLGFLMTHSGRIKGKLPYMAPEALTGQMLDGRSDVFSASVVAHEMLTASPLFAARDDFQIIDRLQNMQPARPSSMNPACPPELDDILLRGLAKDPGARWRSAAEMRAALTRVAVGGNQLATRAELCEWIEQAFELPVPEAPARNTPATTPARRPPPPTGERARLDPEEALVEMVWGGGVPRPPTTVVLDDVPDVSARSLPFDPISHDDPLTGDPFDLVDATVPVDPSAVSSSNPPVSQEMLAQAVIAARRAEALALAVAERQRPSILPIIAIVALAVAGTAVAWIVTRPGEPVAHAPSAPVSAPASVPAPAAPPPSAPAIVADAAPVAPEVAVAPAPTVAEPVEPAAVEPEERRDPPRPRSKRDARRGRRKEAEERRKEADIREPEVKPVEPIAKAPDPPLGADPVPAPASPPPRTAPAPRPKGPLTIPASRTRRESGSVRPIRFPPGEKPPREIVAKLCIDESGAVTSVTVLTPPVSPAVRNAVQRAMSQWRYRPVVEAGVKVTACFATGFPVQAD